MRYLLSSLLFGVLASQTSADLAYVIRGSVVDTSGHAVSQACLEVVAYSGIHPGRSTVAATSADGSFKVDRLDAATYRIYLWKDSAGVPNTRVRVFETSDDQTREVTVGPGAAERSIVLTLPPAYGTLRGHILADASSKPVAKARIRLEQIGKKQATLETDPQQDGSFTFNLPNRPISVTVSAPGYKTWNFPGGFVQLQSGTSTDVEVKLTPLTIP